MNTSPRPPILSKLGVMTPVTKRLGKIEKQMRNMPKFIFGAVCAAVGDDGTLTVSIPSVDDSGVPTTTQMYGLRMFGNDTPNVGDQVLLVNQGGGRVFAMGQQRTSSTPSSGGGGGGGGGSSPLATFYYPGTVQQTDRSAIVPVLYNDTISAVCMTLETPALNGNSCIADVFLNGATIFPITKPTLVSGANILTFALPEVISVVGGTDLLEGRVLTPAGKDLLLTVVR